MRYLLTGVAGLMLLFAGTPFASAQPARDLVEQAADAMGGVDRLRSLESLTLTGFGQYLNQEGGSAPSPDPHAPTKWQAANGAERQFDLHNGRARNSDRRGLMFPYAMESGLSYDLTTRIQTGIAALDHPLPALLAALDPDTRLGAVTVDGPNDVVEFMLASGETLWLGIDHATKLPAFVRWISPSATLGDVTNTAWFTGYVPFDGIELPVGLSTTMDWRDLTTSNFHVDSYRIDDPDFEPVPAPEPRPAREPGQAVATPIADHVWDVRVGGNGSAVFEFDDHLTMFEAYGSEAATFARIDLANTLVPGKAVTEVIVSHHHFDHTGGLRAAVSRGLTIISRRGNEEIFREMVARPAPNFPDALARNPQPLHFVPVDEHLTLEDRTMRVDVYHVVGHAHMAEAVFAYAPAQRVLAEGDFSTYNWELHWWGDAYLDNVELYGLDPAINIPVHGIVTPFDETIATIRRQVQQARDFCRKNERSGVYQAGCPVRSSRF